MDHGARPRSRTRRRRAPRALATIALALVVGLGLASCSGGGDDDRATPSTTTAPRTTEIDIPLGEVSADSAGPPVTVTPEQSQRVIDALTTYVKGAIVQPLRSGQPATADLSSVFDPGTLASATTTDRGVMLDEGLPKVTGDLQVKAYPVALVGLGDQAGKLTLVTAAFLVDVAGATATKGAPLHIVHRGDLVLQTDPFGVWKITAYNLGVLREGADLTATTSTTRGVR
jgi:hypothetical protein